MLAKSIYSLLLAMSVSSTSFAEELSSRFYIGGALGLSKNGIETSNLTNPDVCAVVGSSCTTDDKGRTFQIYAGANIFPYLSVEGAYNDLGNTGEVTDGTITATQETSALTFSILGKLPVSEAFSVYGKIGVARWETDSQVINRSASDHGIDLTFGAGAEYKLNDDFTVRLSWDRYNNVGADRAFLDSAGSRTVDVDVDVISVGVSYNF